MCLLSASPVNKQWAPIAQRGRNLTSLLSLWPGNPGDNLCKRWLQTGSDWMPQGVIAKLHLDGEAHWLAAQSIGRQNALSPRRRSDYQTRFGALFIYLHAVTAFVELARALFTFPDRLSLDCAFWERTNQFLPATPLPRTVEIALTNSCWVFVWWIEFFYHLRWPRDFLLFCINLWPTFSRQ